MSTGFWFGVISRILRDRLIEFTENYRMFVLNDSNAKQISAILKRLVFNGMKDQNTKSHFGANMCGIFRGV